LPIRGRCREWASCSSAFGGGRSLSSHGPSASRGTPVLRSSHSKSLAENRVTAFICRYPRLPVGGHLPANERFEFLCVLGASVVNTRAYLRDPVLSPSCCLPQRGGAYSGDQYFPKGQTGYRHSMQPRQRPPCAMAAKSCRVRCSPARTRGRTRSSTVAL
jgi:hypothetical protein